MRQVWFDGEAKGSETLLKATDVALHDRPEIGVHRCRRQPFKLSKLGRDLMGGADEGVGDLLLDDTTRRDLVNRVEEAIEKADRDGLDPTGFELTGCKAHRLKIEGYLDAAVAAKALGHFETQVARHQDFGLVGVEIVEARALLAADLEEVAKSIGDNKSGGHTLVFDQRVGCDSGAVAKKADGRGSPTDLFKAFFDAASNAARRIVRSGGNLPDIELAGLVLEQTDIGESAARVHTNAPYHLVVSYSVVAARRAADLLRRVKRE